jgi:arylsulfatase
MILHKRIYSAVAIMACMLSLGGASAHAASAESAKPNIVIIMADDLGYSDIGCYGGEIPTPNIDNLAKNGIRFRQFYNNARCCPTRASVLTGLYPHEAGIGLMAGSNHGAPGYIGRMGPNTATMAAWLKQGGYFTAMCGKWHVGGEPAKNGFMRSLAASGTGEIYFPDAKGKKGKSPGITLDGEKIPMRGGFLPDNWYSTDLWTSKSLEFIDEARKERKPFFLYLAYNAPHFPLQAPAEDIARFRGTYLAGWDRLREERFERQKKLGVVDPAWTLGNRPDEIPDWDGLDPDEKDRLDHLMATYAACVYRLDKAVGDFVAGLKARGELENTVIFFFSDNGGSPEAGPRGQTEGDPSQGDSRWYSGESWAYLQNTPFRYYKHFTHEGGISSPLIVRWPKGIKDVNEWRDQITHVIDIAPTISELTGVVYPKTIKNRELLPLEGSSLVPAFSNHPLQRSTLYWEHHGNAAILDGHMKLVRRGRPGKELPWELYDIKVDRTEQNDLAKMQPEQVQRLEQLWREWAVRTHVFPTPETSKKRKKKP